MKVAGLSLGFLLLNGPGLRAEPFVAANPPHLGQITIEGEPILPVPLLRQRVAQDLNFIVTLVPRLSWSDAGVARSRWELPLFTTGLYPLGFDHLYWTMPGGEKLTFRRDGTDSFLPARGWSIQEKSQDEYRIRRNDGWEFFYRRGQLHEVRLKSGIRLLITATGGRIKTLTYVRSDLNLLLFSIAYAVDGQPSEFVGVESKYEMKYSMKGDLISVSSANGGVIASCRYYQSHLLAELDLVGKTRTAVRWASVNNFERGDSLSPAPVYASVIGRERYRSYSDGEVLCLESYQDGKVESLHWNPLSDTMLQK
jgi:hypothetical protein